MPREKRAISTSFMFIINFFVSQLPIGLFAQLVQLSTSLVIIIKNITNAWNLYLILMKLKSLLKQRGGEKLREKESKCARERGE